MDKEKLIKANKINVLIQALDVLKLHMQNSMNIYEMRDSDLKMIKYYIEFMLQNDKDFRKKFNDMIVETLGKYNEELDSL